ncbi:uncharacterized protein LOC142624370 [Castanea sativa]|uniref:uncharacterized protein LOC142624370 n=1 Tax=Castanea sativa TaxID=21020 RepID=UPI003F64B7A0
MVSRKRNGQKGKRTDHGTGFGTGSAGSLAWNSTNQLILVFVEGTVTLVVGPSSSKNLPRRLVNLKIGVGFKNGRKSWASKTPGPKEKPTSSPSMTKLPMDSFKDAVGHIRNLVQEHNPAILVVMETKLGVDRAKAITDRLPMDGAIHTNTIRYFGGLWLLWNSNLVEVELLAKTEQEIHVEVKLSWVIVGDFNESLIDEDKFGGRGVHINRSLAFKECLDRCSMVDMRFFGPRYTWTNKRDISNLILARIDRFFMNPDWCVIYPNARVTHLPMCHSNHCPILMEALPVSTVKLTRPFSLENQLLKELETILDQELDLWKLKSRLNWMIQGDRNTAFYHVSTLARRKRNHIAAVKDERELWITEEREVMGHFRTGFHTLYTTAQEVVTWNPPCLDQWQVQLSEKEKQSLDAMVSTEEIKEALWSMKPYKAPKPDGLHAGFFQRFWLIVGTSVRK